jgi:hypothetical protein
MPHIPGSKLTHISAYGLLRSSASADFNHVIQPFAAFSLQRIAAYLLLDGNGCD